MLRESHNRNRVTHEAQHISRKGQFMNTTVETRPSSSSFSWLIAPGKTAGIQHETFTTLCYGKAAIGRVLGYLVYKASKALPGAAPGKPEAITICCSQQELTTQAAVSLASLGGYLKHLVAWGYLAHVSHSHQYTLHLAAIEQAVAHPPEPLPTLPRGRNATRSVRITEPLPTLPPLSEVEAPSPVTPVLSAARTLLTHLTHERARLLTLEVPTLLNLGNELLNLGNELLNLAMAQTSQPAPQAEAEGILEGDRIYRDQRESKILSCEVSLVTGETKQEEAHASSQGDGSAFPKEEKPKQPAVAPTPRCSSKTVRESIDAIRGYALEQEGPMKNERKLLKGWCEQHTLEEFQAVIAHLTHGTCSNSKHHWWREGGHLKTYFNAAKLVELTPDILAELGHTPVPVMPPEVSTGQQEAIRRREEERGGYQPRRGASPLACFLRPAPEGAVTAVVTGGRS